MAYRRRRSNEQATPAAAAGMVVMLAIVVGAMMTFESTTNPTLIAPWWAAVVCLICAGAALSAIAWAIVKYRAEQARYTKVGGPVLSWQAAEQMAANHMRAYGFSDARTTPSGADGGLDVVSRWGCAQVKFFSNPVGRPDIQKLKGASHGRDRALFYALSGYTPAAVQWADQAQVALWQFDQYGMVWPVNGLARAYKKPEDVTA